MDKDATNSSKQEKENQEIPTGSPISFDTTAETRARTEITVEQAKKLFRQSIWTDADLARKSGMGLTSVLRYWKNGLPTDGMSWIGITNILERALGHVLIIKPKG